MLTIRNLKKTFEAGWGQAGAMVLDGVDLNVAAGETLAVVGESGSGKSTLLHVIGGLEPFDDGEVVLNGVSLTALRDPKGAALRRDVLALVFQQFNLVPSLTVADNIAFQARIAGRHDPAHAARVTARLGLSGLEARYPEELSGGQQQRVAVARAMAARPRLLLADEPTGNLDEATGDTVMDLLLELVRDSGTALILVTHSARLAARLERRVTLSKGRLA